MTPTVGDLPDARQPARAGSPPTARVVAIVELLAEANQPDLTLAEIVRRTSLSRATAHAIVSELVDHGWLSRDQSAGTFAIGPAFAMLARNLGGADHLLRWATLAARELSARFDVPCFVARRTAPDVATIAAHAFPSQSAAGAGLHQWLRDGARVRLRPPISREFIAWDSAPAQAAWVARAPESSRTRLRLALDAVAERGYSIERMTADHGAIIDALGSLATVSDSLRTRVDDLLTELSVIDYLADELEEFAAAGAEVPVVTIGAPVFDADEQVTAAIVTCPNSSLSAGELRELGEATRDAARGISAHLR